MKRKLSLLAMAFALFLTSGLPVDTVYAALAPDKKAIINHGEYFDKNEYSICGPGSGPAGGPSSGLAGSTVPHDFSLGTAPTERRMNFISNMMADFGLTAEQAAGVLGNFMHESGGKDIPPNINERLGIAGDGAGPPRRVVAGVNTGGYGWAQWTGSRKTAFIEFAIANGFMASWDVHGTDAANYAYLKHELSTGYTSTITRLKNTSTPEDAAVSFEATFERAGNPALGPRMRNARDAFNEFTSGGADAVPGEGTGTGGGTVSPVACAGQTPGSATIVGGTAFPLVGNKSVVKNPQIFTSNSTLQGGHPYTAFDINADPGVPVVAFMGGTVTLITQDRCPGRLISIYNEQADLTVSYMHLAFSGHVAEGATVNAGDSVGVVGPASAGCGTAHLHIDVAKGNRRPGCSRLDCPAANQAFFVDIGPQLYQTYMALPDANTSL